MKFLGVDFSAASTQFQFLYRLCYGLTDHCCSNFWCSVYFFRLHLKQCQLFQAKVERDWDKSFSARVSNGKLEKNEKKKNE